MAAFDDTFNKKLEFYELLDALAEGEDVRVIDIQVQVYNTTVTEQIKGSE